MGDFPVKLLKKQGVEEVIFQPFRVLPPLYQHNQTERAQKQKSDKRAISLSSFIRLSLYLPSQFR